MNQNNFQNSQQQNNNKFLEYQQSVQYPNSGIHLPENDFDKGPHPLKRHVDSKSTASLPMTGSLPLPDLNSRAKIMQG
jgi:hypothetical protein|tara:strand:+ start:247 stop:480 length:234 start_codon:yes stop_codon:yes gene_type:complete